ncbi:hypothetical protein [Bacillus sp. UNC41MFS5]|uniref:hypothetical protein n=1 Tax=Bacillus sp. UNC41MFS5 TaxID=1449046 RepID=UPI00047C40A2|nr:hypothetical protein [Bacillus sp. UNC41MFS5]
MNVALLNDYKIDIESLSIELEEQGYERKEVKEQLNERFRRFSQKGDFRCICCDERVEMVLALDKIFHFRHFDKEHCSYSENHRTYTRQKENLEDVPRHRAGKAILRTYLEGTCKTHGIRLSDGYHCKSTLSFVPDFILEFPNGHIWAIDYITGLKSDIKYANGLIKRRNTYIQHQFTPIFLIDSYWLAYESEINHVSLVDGELLCVRETTQDDLWTDFIKGLGLNLQNTLLNNRPYSLQVKSMAYVSPYEREINIIRFLQETHNPKKTRTVYKPIKIPLDQALLINHEQSDFTYTRDNEDEYREELKRQLITIYQEQEDLREQQEIESVRKAEEERKLREFARAREAQKQKEAQRTREYYESKGVPFSGRSQLQMDADIERDAEYLQRKNSPLEPYWYKQVVKHMSKFYGIDSEAEEHAQATIDETSSKKVVVGPNRILRNTQETVIDVASKLPGWKVEEILNHYVNGEAYFTGNSRKWKEIVLDSFMDIYFNKISVPQLLQKIKDNGIKFDQPEKIMSFPINEYIQYVGKKIKKDVRF